MCKQVPHDEERMQELRRYRQPYGTGDLPRVIGCKLAWCIFAISLLSFAGCTSFSNYVHNGFKVGPNYGKPPAPVAPHWIDADDARVHSTAFDDSRWWTVFNDPTLDALVRTAYRQNITLREAGCRVLQSRAQLGIAVGEMFPQSQAMSGDFQQKGVSVNVANRSATPQRWYSQWDYGFGLGWELDFWGRFRRAIESGEAALDASVENYDAVLVTLVGDVASTYVQIRTLQQKIAYARATLVLQKESLSLATAKFNGGQTSEIDVNQGQSDVSTTEGLIEQDLISLRQSMNQLCILLGMPPADLEQKLGVSPIPTAPPEVVVGVPAELMRRRPDVRRAERQAAAQSAQIGIAEADFYPSLGISGTFGWSSQEFTDLFEPSSFRGSVGPTFQWQILNYGRIANNVRFQDAKFQQLVATYQNTVLQAGKEVEDGLVTFLRAQKSARSYATAVSSLDAAYKEAFTQYQNGMVDYNRVVLIQERLVERQQTLAQAQGQIAQGLIQIYRALGGGWQLRFDPAAANQTAAMPTPAEPEPAPKAVEEIPQPAAEVR